MTSSFRPWPNFCIANRLQRWMSSHFTPPSQTESFTHSFAPWSQPFCTSGKVQQAAAAHTCTQSRLQKVAKLPVAFTKDKLFLEESTGTHRVPAPPTMQFISYYPVYSGNERGHERRLRAKLCFDHAASGRMRKNAIRKSESVNRVSFLAGEKSSEQRARGSGDRAPSLE